MIGLANCNKQFLEGFGFGEVLRNLPPIHEYVYVPPKLQPRFRFIVLVLVVYRYLVLHTHILSLCLSAYL